MNLGTLPQLLNNLSLKLNSPLNADGQTPANTSVLVANTTSEAKNSSLADGSATNSSTGDQNSTIASFAALQSEVTEVAKLYKWYETVICASFKGFGGWQADIDKACRQSCSVVGSNSGYRLSSLPSLPSFHVIIISNKSQNMCQKAGNC